MYKIVKKQELTTNIYLMEVEAKRVAKSCEPGQFVIVRVDSEGERIPLTICDYNRETGTVTIVFQTVGAGTKLMAVLEEGDALHDFVGPLGCPSEFVKEDIEELKNKKILFVAGGVGAAPVYPQVKWLHEHGIAADVIVGSKTKDLLILEKEMEAVAVWVVIAMGAAILIGIVGNGMTKAGNLDQLPDGETMPPVKRAMFLPVFDVLITGRFISVAFPQSDRYAFSRTP